MKKSEPKGASVHFPPPIIFLILIGGGYGLERYYHSFADLLQGRMVGLGWVCIVLAIVLLKLSFQKFTDTGQNPKPWLESPQLIIEGVYCYTRNPMYVALVLIQLGVGLNLSNLWIIGFTPVSLELVYLIAVAPEEKYLKKKFGKKYVAYTKRVHRWI